MNLELEDIQHYLLTRPNARTAQYDFLSFKNPEAGRKWLGGMINIIGTAKSVLEANETDMRWVSIAFTFNGLKALGVDEESLSTFPVAFKEGMAARAKMLGDTGENHPDNWQDNITSPDLHAVLILFAVDKEQRIRSVNNHHNYLKQNPGVEILSSLLLEAIPPFDYPHEHFGYRDRITTPAIEGLGNATPGSSPTIKPGEFILGYSDETGTIQILPKPDILTKNGSFLAYRKMEEHVGAFRDYLKANGKTEQEQELVAAKLMGRWRKSGAPLVLAPEKDDVALGLDDSRNNDFDYEKMDPHGYACPHGAHIRRMNVRNSTISNIPNRRLIIRRGGTYGPALPEDAPEDGAERGVAVFAGCADIARQFEFLISVWANDPNFMELHERDPIIGTQDGTLDMTIPNRPIRKKLKSLPAFTNVRAGAYFFLPGIKGLRYLASPKK